MSAGEPKPPSGAVTTPLPTCSVGDTVRKLGGHQLFEVLGLDEFSVRARFVDAATGAVQSTHLLYGEIEVVRAARARDEFRLLRPSELAAVAKTPSVVAGVMRRGDLIVAFADAGDGKTFFALDMSLHIVTGLAWCGRAVTQGPVVYVAAEGRSGLWNRIEAWNRQHSSMREAVESGLRVLARPLELIKGDFAPLQLAIDASGPSPVLVVLDTVAMTMGGDENSTLEMSQYVMRLRQLSARYGCAVMLAHHTNAGGVRERGNTALRAAAESMLKLTKRGVRVSVEWKKQRDDAPLKQLQFELVSVDVGSDAQGQPATSCYISPRGLVGTETTTGNKPTAEVSVLRELSLAETKLTQAQLRSRLKLSKGSVSKALKALLLAGKVIRDDTSQPSVYGVAGREYVLVSDADLVSSVEGNPRPSKFPEPATPVGGGSRKQGKVPRKRKEPR